MTPRGRADIRGRIVAWIGVGLVALGLVGLAPGEAPAALVGGILTSAQAAATLGTATRQSPTTTNPTAAPTTTNPTAASATTTPTASSTPVAGPCTTALTGTGGDRNIDLRVDGYQRSFRLYVPGRIPAGRRLPVIVALHGFKDTGKNMERYSGFSALASRDGFIVAYPNALGGDWAIYSTGPRGAADLDFVRATIAYIESGYCVDQTRVFAVGVSNGGGEASRVACALSSSVSAVAIVAGDYRKMPPCSPARPTSIFDIHATSDPVVPYLGASGTHDGSVPAYLAMWRSLDACAVPGRHGRVNADVVRARWTCTDGTSVSQLKLTHGGHFWPGSSQRASTLPALGSAGAEIWSFFSGLPSRPS